jgi:hypothetical protein
MYRYKYNTSYHHKSRKAKRTTVVATVVSLLVVIAIGLIGADIFYQAYHKQAPTSQPTYSSVQGASVNLFRTEYFQFQTNNTWKEVPSETKKDHFVYASFNGPLVEHDLTIDINKPQDIPANVHTTHVMPVQIESTGRLSIIAGAGEHCKTLMPKDSRPFPTLVTQKQVSFYCAVDNVLYEVKVGVVGGTTNMVMTRPDGTKATYTITYRNLQFTPSDTMLRSIVETFQAR